jgi:flagellar basal-body rod protein FlgB
MSAFLFDRLHNGLGKVLDLRYAQHGLTASNIANASTPGYRAKYIPFDRVLAQAVGRGDSMEMHRTDTRHLFASGSDPSNPEVSEIEPAPWQLDDNSVDPDKEVVRLTENSVMYDAVSMGLSRRIAMLRYAANNGSTA